MKPFIRLLVPTLLLASAALRPARVEARQRPAQPAAEAAQRAAPLNALPGPDRIVILPGKTYLNGWVGYGEPPRRDRRRKVPDTTPPPAGPPPAAHWSKESGPGSVTFADAGSAVTTATFSAPGSYVLKLTADNGESRIARTLRVEARSAAPLRRLEPVITKRYKIDSPLWNQRVKALIVNWIPHCIDQIERTDLTQGAGGIDNFIEAAKALAGLPHGAHKGYVFSNAWVHQTVEAMSIALMIDPRGDPEIARAQQKMRAVLEDWIPKILAAQEPDGYLHTAFTLRDPQRWPERWWPQGRGNHEGYVGGYFLEAALNHYVMSDMKDRRLYEAARRLADCWAANIGPAPKREWFDGHQEMEQALMRFGRFVERTEGGGKGRKYMELAKFLLDSRRNGTEYDQSHLPVVQQYEAVGHAVRAVYNYSGMADVVMETGDVDYQSAVGSLWDSIVNKKYYVTGGVGSGETSEGFGPEYSLRQNAYCESCSSCGLIFFQWKMNLAYGDARYADLYEETLFNALLGAIDLEGRNFYYQNPLDSGSPRYPWHACPCCVGNIPRTLLMLPTWMYARSADAVYVNLYVGSTVTVENVAGTDVEMAQRTNYPWDGKVSITINPRAGRSFGVAVRVPDRSVSELYQDFPQADGITSIALNGRTVRPAVENGYAVIRREWKAGDRIDLVLPLVPQRVRASEKIEATRGRVALKYGPLVYNIEQVDQDIAQSVGPDSRLTAEWNPDLLGGVVAIRGTFAGGAPLLAIPNYARNNRGPVPVEQPPAAPGTRPAPRPPTSIVWIREQR